MDHEERIQLEMQETRAALAEKLVILEGKVAGTVEQVTNAVTDTVEAIKDTVQDTRATVSAVNESVQDGVKSVQDCLDVNAQVQAHPWLMLAGSVAAGFCLGTLLNQRTEPSRSAQSFDNNRGDTPVRNGGTFETLRNGNGTPISPPKEARSIWAPEIDKLKGLALGALFGTAREMIASSLPEPINQQVKDIIDSATKKAGGEPIASAAFASLLQPKSTPEECGSVHVQTGF